ncbi:hypothetical protein cgR_0127 [Corynebacterium glutamicum R]|uniref:Transcriptional regulator n=2 Tax=Corynebacterium glutamicum TaxID=1718 RepID=Q5KRS2_CORGT|nr:transcriptional regulator [Corynebacterium glutamicum]BAF53088.1 hypothetical protein cgR_0127 [Corynebacterium glutamicum R]
MAVIISRRSSYCPNFATAPINTGRCDHAEQGHRGQGGRGSEHVSGADQADASQWHIVATRAHVLPSLLGKGEQAFLGIQIRPQARDTANDFVHKALALPETLALYNVSGNEDYLVHVAVSDSTALQALIIDKFLALPQVAHCRTQLIFGDPWVAPLQHSPE